MSSYDLVIDGTQYQVDIVELAGTAATVTVNGVTYQVELPAGAAVAASPRSVSAAPKAAPAPVKAAPAPVAPKAAPTPSAAVPASAEVVNAPMPGHILSVLVAVGDPVEVGDTLVVMEAMKMENEIKSHVAGTVRELRVSKGQDVGVGEVLAVIGG